MISNTMLLIIIIRNTLVTINLTVAITIMMSIVRWLGIIHRVGLFVMVGVVGMVIFCLLLTSVVYPFQECVIKIPG